MSITNFCFSSLQDNLGIHCFTFTTPLIGFTAVPAVAVAITAAVVVMAEEAVVTTEVTQVHRTSTKPPFRACRHPALSGTPTSLTVKCLSPTALAELEAMSAEVSGEAEEEVLTTTTPSMEVEVVAAMVVRLVPH